MSFWRPDVYLTDRLCWYERIGVVMWWLGQAAFAFSVMASIGLVAAALYRPLAGIPATTVIQSALVLVLAGFAALLATRLALVLLMRGSDVGRH